MIIEISPLELCALYKKEATLTSQQTCYREVAKKLESLLLIQNGKMFRDAVEGLLNELIAVAKCGE